MSYTPHTWVDNETITAAKLNNIEDGVQEAAQSGGGGFDAEIKMFHDGNSSHDYAITIVSGSHASLYEKLSNNETPTVLVRIFDDLTHVFTATPLVSFYNWGNEGITFFVKAPKNNASGTYNTDWQSWAYMWWSNEDQIYLD